VGAVRRGADQIYRVLIAVFFFACIVQIFLAGRGVFGIRSSNTHHKPGDFFDHQHSLNPHRALGFILGFAAILLLLLTLIAWNKAILPWTFALAVLALLVQSITAIPSHPWVAAFHPISGVAILGISGWLAHRAWRRRSDRGRSPARA
jgi:hypothetical protein